MHTIEEALRPAPKIFKETCRIDWNMGVKKVYDFIRGLSPYPAAWTELCTKDGVRQVMKIYKTAKIFEDHNLKVGEVVTDHKTFMKIALKDGFIDILELQLAGKKKMMTTDFLRGYRNADGNYVE